MGIKNKSKNVLSLAAIASLVLLLSLGEIIIPIVINEKLLPDAGDHTLADYQYCLRYYEEDGEIQKTPQHGQPPLTKENSRCNLLVSKHLDTPPFEGTSNQLTFLDRSDGHDQRYVYVIKVRLPEQNPIITSSRLDIEIPLVRNDGTITYYKESRSIIRDWIYPGQTYRITGTARFSDEYRFANDVAVVKWKLSNLDGIYNRS